MFGPPPEGLGEFKSWMTKVSVAYGVAMLGVGVAVVAVPIMAGRPNLAAYAPIPLNALTVGYFAWWIPTQRRVTRRIREGEGQLCWYCAYPGATTLGSVCVECGHEHTQKNINELTNARKGQLPRSYTKPPKVTPTPTDGAP